MSNDAPGPLEATATLLAQVRAGDAAARERLFARFLPLLQRWAHGRLPRYARDTVDTDDLVQVSLVRALNRLEDFEPRGEGAFLAYLRRILLNSIRDEIRRIGRRPTSESLPDEYPDCLPSLVEQAVGKETVQAYETALAKQPKAKQEAIVLRIEFGYTYEEIAQALGRPSANAARMMVSRALADLAEEMGGTG